MLIRLMLVAGVGLLLTACPRTADQTQPPAASTAVRQDAKPRSTLPAPKEGDVLAVINNFAAALNDQDLDAFTACFHPESKELEEMLGFFEEFDPASQKFELSNLSVEELTAKEALVEYTVTFSEADGGDVEETESGEFELVKTDDDKWVIWDLN